MVLDELVWFWLGMNGVVGFTTTVPEVVVLLVALVGDSGLMVIVLLDVLFDIYNYYYLYLNCHI